MSWPSESVILQYFFQFYLETFLALQKNQDSLKTSRVTREILFNFARHVPFTSLINVPLYV